MMSYFSCRLVIWYSLNHACTINTVTHFTQRKSWTADTNWLMYFKVCFHGNNELYIIYSNKNKRVKLPTDRKIPTMLCYNRFIIISDNHQCWVYDKGIFTKNYYCATSRYWRTLFHGVNTCTNKLLPVLLSIYQNHI